MKNLATFLSEQGHTCQVIILTKKKSQGWADLEGKMQVHYLPFKRYMIGAVALIPFLALKGYRNFDYTFSSQTIINGVLGFAKRIGLFKKTKVILRESNSIFELLKGNKLRIYKFFYEIGYSGSSLIICQTDYMKRQLLENLPKLTEKNIKTIPNPFDFDDIKNRSGRIASQYEPIRYIVGAGRLAPAKGFDLLIEAFSKLDTKELHLIILGEGAEREALQNIIEQKGLQNRIHMPGYVQSVYAYFENAEACVLSSRIEGFPNVLLQMMSQNTKIVATLSAGDIEKIPGIVTCPPHDSSHLKIAIEKALSNDTESNRAIFDTYLQSRTQMAFLERIFEYL